MRARNLKPSFFKNEDLARLPPLTRLLFEGLWCMADREGRLEDRPMKIKAEVLPYDNCDIEAMLESLQEFSEPFIMRYEVDGKRYIQVTKSSAHFNPHPNEKQSEFPKCSIKLQPKNKALVKCNVPLALNPDVMNPDVMNPSSVATPPISFSFAEVYDLYPNKDSRKDAERHFKASVKTEQDYADIKKAVVNYVRHLQAETWKQPKSAKTWFNDWRPWVTYKGVTIKAPEPIARPKPVEPVESEEDRAELLRNIEERQKMAGAGKEIPR